MERRRCLHEREPDAEAAWARSSPQADDLVVEERGVIQAVARPPTRRILPVVPTRSGARRLRI